MTGRCWSCIFARKAEIRFVAETDPARIDCLQRVLDAMERDPAPKRRLPKPKPPPTIHDWVDRNFDAILIMVLFPVALVFTLWLLRSCGMLL
ncbi:MAG: hypothetical protein D6724_08825 [Armatimonadetes bacterium]|nr:MAG: hypothetical protein D6724_08825 [Armatimonadota bacterium]